MISCSFFDSLLAMARPSIVAREDHAGHRLAAALDAAAFLDGGREAVGGIERDAANRGFGFFLDLRLAFRVLAPVRMQEASGLVELLFEVVIRVDDERVLLFP